MTGQIAGAANSGRSTSRHDLLRVLIVDDRDMVRQGLALLLDAGRGITTCGEAASLAEAAQVAGQLQPDIVVADVRLAAAPGSIQAARAIRDGRPRTHLLFLTAFADSDSLLDAVLSGASGYLLKQVSGARLVRDLLRVIQGEALLDAPVIDAALNRLKFLLRAHRSALSSAEEEVLSGIAHGDTDGQIAAHLDIPLAEVTERIGGILAKLSRARAGEGASPGVASRA